MFDRWITIGLRALGTCLTILGVGCALLSATPGHGSEVPYPHYRARVDVVVSGGPRALCWADFDGDGDLDAAVCRTDAGRVAVLRNQGYTQAGTTGTLVAAGDYYAGTTPVAVVAADLDGDGDPDLAVSASGSNWISVLLNQGGSQGGVRGVFGPASFCASGSAPRGLVAADLDGDGDVDLASANQSGNGVSVFRNGGNGTFGAATSYFTSGNPTGIAVLDFDQDGDPDLAATLFSTDKVIILRNQGFAQGGSIGAFGSTVSFGVGDGPVAVTAGDWNGDGRTDLATANQYGDSVSVLTNSGGNFAAAVQSQVGNYPSHIENADVDGDGRSDLVVAGANTDSTQVLRNFGGGSYAGSVTYRVGDNPMWVTMVDCDSDGDTDIATANEAGNCVSILVNGGRMQGGIEGTFLTSDSYACAGNPKSVALGDVDGDLDPDAIVANIGSSDLSIFVNQGGAQGGTLATFSLPTTIYIGDLPQGVVLGDINGDGDKDIVLANGNSSAVVLSNLGGAEGGTTGTFSSPKRYTVGLNPRSLALADLDGDGDLDLATANNESSNVSVLLNQGGKQSGTPGVFGSAANVNVQLEPRAVAAGDLDGDGDQDLAAANFTSDTVSLVVNQGGKQNGTNGNFLLGSSLPAGDGPSGIAFCDVDRDKDLDVLVTCYFSDELVVLLNGGGKQGGTTGTFTLGAAYTTGDGPMDLIAADLDGDRDPDAGVSCSNNRQVAVFLNKGGNQSGIAGTFTTSTLFGCGTGTSGLAVADLDLDVPPDLVATNIQDNSITVLLNRMVYYPVIEWNPSSLDFGVVELISPPASRTLALQNTGLVPLAVFADLMDSSGGAFAIATPPPPSIPSDGSVMVSVAFDPAAVGGYTGTLRLNTNDPLHPEVIVPLSGAGTERVPPVSQGSTGDITQVGPPITGTYTASDTGGSGLESVTLYVKIPGGNWTSKGTVTGGTWAFSPAATGDAVDGIYRFAMVARDGVGNMEPAPVGNDPGDVAVIFNDSPNSQFEYASVTGGAYVFPMLPQLDLTVEFTTGTLGGPVSIMRGIGDVALPGYTASSLIDEYLIVTGTFAGWATLVWPYDPASVISIGQLPNGVLQVQGGNVAPHYSIVPVGNTLRIPWLYSFGAFYAGVLPAAAQDWQLLE